MFIENIMDELLFSNHVGYITLSDIYISYSYYFIAK